ncbi:MAG: UbiX family flavin prenyltransferase [Methylacidiphilales bacterium]|nr:UbiX family flavin prenyltransferase [Candidatus Methylacidiphilales bacterium]
MAGSRRLIVGISGASGAVLGIRLLQALQSLDVEVHLVVSKAAELTIAQETDVTLAEVLALADHVHEVANVGATIASGSFPTLGMAIVPCSIRTMSEIAAGVTSSLLTRAADVVLKERRRLVLAVRETPLHALHLRHLADLAAAGAIIAPPVPAFYTRPKTVDDIVDQSVGRILGLFGIDAGLAIQWRGLG